MPNESSNSASGDFTHTDSGTNSEGNHWCARDYGKAETGYHYSNSDGSYFYNNPDGSKYFNDGKGFWKYTSPNGHTTKSHGK